MILGVQILGIIFGLFMAYLSFFHYRRRVFNKAQFLFWTILWLGFVVIVIFPEIVQGITKKLGAVRTMDLLAIVAFMFVTFLTFYNYLTLNKIKQKLEKTVREEALKDLQK